MSQRVLSVSLFSAQRNFVSSKRRVSDRTDHLLPYIHKPCRMVSADMFTVYVVL